LTKELKGINTSSDEDIKKAFIHVDSLVDDSEIDCGTTCVTAFILKDEEKNEIEVTCANTGDR
jgi:hypothetical protein